MVDINAFYLVCTSPVHDINLLIKKGATLGNICLPDEKADEIGKALLEAIKQDNSKELNKFVSMCSGNEILLNYASPTDGETPLICAASNRHLPALKLLLSQPCVDGSKDNGG